MSDIKRLDLSSAWDAKTLATHPDWSYHLSSNELKEIDEALSHCCEIPIEQMKKSDFRIPALEKKIQERWSAQLESGIGTLLIKGIDTSKYAKEALARILWGIGRYFGRAVSQSVEGEKLHGVKDDGYDLSHPKARGTNTKIKLWFHNDTCDVAALMCARKSKSGGESQIVSSVAIHNKMVSEYPELAACLYQDYYFLRHNVNTTQAEPYTKHPIFAFEQGYFACNILRPLIDKAQELPEVPKMSESQVEALNKFEELAESQELCHEFTLEPGDIFFVNNFVTLHSRKAFEDEEEQDMKRLLFRLWLSTPNSRPLPDSFKPIYHDTRAGAYRGGILPKV